MFCTELATWIDYKDVNLLKRFMSNRGKIRARLATGNCAQHQRDVQMAIKTAREVALLPYTQRTVSERGPGRGPRPPRGEGGERPPAGADGPVDDLGDLEDEEAEETGAELEKVEA